MPEGTKKARQAGCTLQCGPERAAFSKHKQEVSEWNHGLYRQKA